MQYESAPGVWTNAQLGTNVDNDTESYFVVVNAGETTVNVRVNTINEEPDLNDGGEHLLLNAVISDNASGDISDMANIQAVSQVTVLEAPKIIEFDATTTNVGTAEDVSVAGEDILVFKTTGENIDFSALGNDKIINIETIDLNSDVSGSNGIHNLTNISLADVIALTDSNNELKILGDSADNVSLKNADWDVGTVGTGADAGLTVYTGSDNDTVLKIDQDINTSII